jgi:hypothetical protein
MNHGGRGGHGGKAREKRCAGFAISTDDDPSRQKGGGAGCEQARSFFLTSLGLSSLCFSSVSTASTVSYVAKYF